MPFPLYTDFSVKGQLQNHHHTSQYEHITSLSLCGASITILRFIKEIVYCFLLKDAVERTVLLLRTVFGVRPVIMTHDSRGFLSPSSKMEHQDVS
jgi:hypothetical protein